MKTAYSFKELLAKTGMSAHALRHACESPTVLPSIIKHAVNPGETWHKVWLTNTLIVRLTLLRKYDAVRALLNDQVPA